MNKLVKRLLTGTLAFATILTALPVTAVHASGNQYWTESAERVGYIEHVMNDGSIKSTFNEGHMKVEGETAYCVDINTSFKNGYKTRSDASTRMSSDQIADVALSLEYVKQYTASHTNLNYKQGYLLEQCVVWQRLSEQLGWQCDNVRASYNEISQAGKYSDFVPSDPTDVVFPAIPRRSRTDYSPYYYILYSPSLPSRPQWHAGRWRTPAAYAPFRRLPHWAFLCRR